MKFIESLAIAPLLQSEYQEFRDFLMRAIEVEGTDETIDAIRLAAQNNFITIDDSGITLIQDGRRLTFSELSEYIDLLRNLYPYTYDCDGNLVYSETPTDGGAVIDDGTTALDKTWSSSKINSSLATKQPTGNYIVEGDARLTNARPPTGAAGGDFASSTYPNLFLPTTGVTAGVYTSPNIAVDAKGRVTAIASNPVSYGSTAPSSPTDGQLWLEPNAPLPQPWVWDNASGLWLSQPFFLDYGATTATFASGSGTGLNRTFPYYATSSNRIKIIAIRGMYSTDSATNSSSTSNHTTTDYYSAKLRKFRGSDTALTDFYTFTTTSASMTTSGATAYRRFTETPNIWLEGNVFVVNWYLIRNGSASGSFSINTNMQIWMQAARGVV